MMDHFSHYDIEELLHADDAHACLKQSRSLLAYCIRGRDVINVLREAKRRWMAEPLWREKALECINAFGERRTADASQVALLHQLFDDTSWEAKCANELNLPRALDSVYEGTRAEAMLAYRPLGVVLHVSPGNSFLGGVDSMLHGIVTGNQNIVKVSRNTPAVISVVLELLQACGLPQGQVVPVLWGGGNAEIESVLCAGVDGVIAWGGDATIQHYKTRLPIGVRFLEYGPKLSFSLLSLKGNRESLAELVKDVCAFEQMSCSSSQFLLVELPENESDAPLFKHQLLAQLSQLFSAYAQHTPPAQKTKHEQVEMLKALERAKLAKVMGRGDYVSGYPDWLVVWMEDEKPIQPSPLFRTWLIYPYQHKHQLQERLLPIRHYLQTAGVACGADELTGIAELLWSAGVNRVVTPGRSCTPTQGAPHDGGSILAGLCRITSLETEESTRCLWRAGTKEETLKALHEIVTASRRAPFYEHSEKHTAFCQNPTWEAFYALPWLTKNDFYLYGPPKSSDLLTIPFDKARRAYLITTGGSTGAPKYAMYNQQEWEEGTDIFCRALETAGITPDDHVVNLFVGGGLWSAFIAVDQALEKLGCLNLPVGGLMDPNEMLVLLQSLGATAVYGLTSTLLRLANAAENHPELHVRIPKIMYGGEHMSASMQSYIAQVFDAKIIRSAVYASVDAGCIGYQCQHVEKGYFHGLERYAHVEIADLETGFPVEQGQVGEVVVTNLSRRLFPIIRVRTGDLGRQVVNTCSCGSTNFTFELLGRSDDMVRIASANVHINDVEKICQQFHSYLSLMYQLRIDRVGLDDRYVLCIETKSGLHPEHVKDLTAEVKQAYLALADDLRDTMKKGLLRYFELKLLAPGAIEGNGKTGKVRRVLDLR